MNPITNGAVIFIYLLNLDLMQIATFIHSTFELRASIICSNGNHVSNIHVRLFTQRCTNHYRDLTLVFLLVQLYGHWKFTVLKGKDTVKEYT